jgi:hypothetical protein
VPITALMSRLQRIALLGCVLLAAVCSASPAASATPRGRLLPDGEAVAPPTAPPTVQAMIEAANRIRHLPYIWGGGHRSWASRGYDCSGSVSYVMHAAGRLESPLDSTGFMRWGAPGPGSWVQIYANREHVFAVIAGLRWDTSMPTEGDGSGPGWSEQMRSTQGFRLRHPTGLLGAAFVIE